MALWTQKGVGVTDVTDVATDVEIVAPDEVRDFVASHDGRLYVLDSRCTEEVRHAVSPGDLARAS